METRVGYYLSSPKFSRSNDISLHTIYYKLLEGKYVHISG